MKQKKALDGSHLEVFLAPQCSTEHDTDLSISNLFLTFVQLLQEMHLKAFLEKFSFENHKLIKIDVWFPSNTYTVLDSVNIRKRINIAIRDYTRHMIPLFKGDLAGSLKSVQVFCKHYEI